jgi:hypothetical protein
MKIRFTIPNAAFIPNVDIPLEGGGSVNNKDRDKLDELGITQITAKNLIANVDRKQKYLGTETTYRKDGTIRTQRFTEYRMAVRERCKSLTGLEEAGITDGESLVKFAGEGDMIPHPIFFDNLIDELFLHINGGHVDNEEMPESE